MNRDEEKRRKERKEINGVVKNMILYGNTNHNNVTLT
jgi:hypothetical protein